MRHITRADLLPYEVDLPPLPEQRAIAAILDTIDDAIRKTEQIIAKLQPVKQGLLHDLLTRGIDDNGELRDPERHPEQFQDSPLGRIPKGWECSALFHWLDGGPKNGYSPEESSDPSGTLMLGLGCLTPDGFAPAQLKHAPRGDSRLKKVLLSDGDLLLSRANTRELVALVGIYRDVGGPCTYPDLMMRLRPSRSTNAAFLELVLRSFPSRRQLQAAATGTSASMVKVSSAIVRSLIVAIPRADEQERILVRCDALRRRFDRERDQRDKQRALKAGLAEDLLTGRVRTTPLAEVAA